MNTITQEQLGLKIETGTFAATVKSKVREAISSVVKILTVLDAQFARAREVDERIREMKDEHLARFYYRPF